MKIYMYTCACVYVWFKDTLTNEHAMINLVSKGRMLGTAHLTDGKHTPRQTPQRSQS